MHPEQHRRVVFMDSTDYAYLNDNLELDTVDALLGHPENIFWETADAPLEFGAPDSFYAAFDAEFADFTLPSDNTSFTQMQDHAEVMSAIGQSLKQQESSETYAWKTGGGEEAPASFAGATAKLINSYGIADEAFASVIKSQSALHAQEWRIAAEKSSPAFAGALAEPENTHEIGGDALLSKGGMSALAPVVEAFEAPQADLLAAPAGDTFTYTTNALDALLYIRSGYSTCRWNFTSSLGTPVELTFSFLQSVPSYGNPISYPRFTAFSAAQESAVKSILASVSEFANITFKEVEGEGDLTFGNYFMNIPFVVAYATIAFGDLQTGTMPQRAGDIWVDTNADWGRTLNGPWSKYPGGQGYHTLIHEIGHSLGLKHSFEDGDYRLAPDLDSDKYTQMSYEHAFMAKDSQNDGYVGLFPSTFMPFDMEALQYIYGVNTSTRRGNTIYSWAATPKVVETIWDGGGNDTIDCSNQILSCNIKLQESTHSSISTWGTVAIAKSVIIENAIGGSADDSLTGNAVNNLLRGGGGNDLLYGGLGADTLEGVTGNDTLYGEKGNDFLYGGDGEDWLNGGADADYMAGGNGNDNYIVGSPEDKVIEATNGGIDTVRSSISYILGSNVENIKLTDSANINGTGNSLANTLTGNESVNILNGGQGNDKLSGGGGNDTLYGGDGNDYLNGDTGADYMEGGAGNDMYVVDNTKDRVIEYASAGIDTMRSSISFALGDNMEKLELTGIGNINGTGNALANTITGNEGVNSLDCGAGNDTIYGNGGDDRLYGREGNDLLNGGTGVDYMRGGTGNDIYIVDNTKDSAVEYVDEGIDTVRSSVSYTLGANIEKLELTGTDSKLSGIGNALANTITGSACVNTLDGGAGNDMLYGKSWDDGLYGRDGNDLLDGGGGADNMNGGIGDDGYIVDNINDRAVEYVSEGIDTVRSSASSYTLGAEVEKLELMGVGKIQGTGNALANTISGNSANNTLNGGGGDDTLYGGAGSDLLDGGIGADYMKGGKDHDWYIVDNTKDRVVEYAGEGVDWVLASVSYTLSDNVETLELTGTRNSNGTGNALANRINGNDGNNILNGGDGNDTLDGEVGNDVLNGGGGADNMWGGAGNDIYVVDNAKDSVSEAFNGGIDTVRASISYVLDTQVEKLELTGAGNINGTGNVLANTITGNETVNTLDGGAGNDTLYGKGGDDGLYGRDGNDYLDGGVGGDYMKGGTGDDVYIVDNTKDRAVEYVGEGIDTVRSSISYSLGAEVEKLELTGAGNINGTGNILVNTLTGNNGHNTLAGEQGDDMLYGGAGNDVLNGGIGADYMKGGIGDDVYIVDNIKDREVECADEGIDTVRSSVSYALGGDVEHLELTGTGSINGTGNTLANTLTGNAGHNTLDGGRGNDTLYGGAGNDVLNGGIGEDDMNGGIGNDLYIADNAKDRAIEYADEGIDTVRASASYTLGANVENLEFDAFGNLNGTGNALANTLTGNGWENTLDGGKGNDTLYGEAGNDALNGGVGADYMDGGVGNDVYVVDNAGDKVIEAANAGTDTVRASISYTLGANAEKLELTGTGNINGVGNVLANMLTGNEGSNALDGGVGNDTLWGNSGNDTLYGGNGFDFLYGGNGNDLLHGGLDGSHMEGGAGNDTYVVGRTRDEVQEAVNEGIDTVLSDFSYGLGRDVENLELRGTGNFTGTGNALANTLRGNEGQNVLDGEAGNDTLYGNGGNDTLYGGADNDTLHGGAGNDLLSGEDGADSMEGGTGNDIYDVDNAGDKVIEAANAGTDTVRSTVSFALGDNVENLELGIFGKLDGTGNALANTLTGNGSRNTLDGGAGNDTLYGGEHDDTLYGGAGDDYLDGGVNADYMEGGAGNDIYVADNVGDTVTEGASAGTDTVRSSITYTLGANVENLELTGPGIINGTGNVLANTVTGNEGLNTLNGGQGNDTLYGGAGADILYGGDGNDWLDGGAGPDVDRMEGGNGNDTYVVNSSWDQVIEAADAGTDAVRSSITYTLGATLEHLKLTSSGNINGTGNALANTITGNNGNNSLSGGAGNDKLYGGAGDDILDGGNGTDWLFGQAGADKLSGGVGNDIFGYTLTTDSLLSAPDRIFDFVLGQDKLDFSKFDVNPSTSTMDHLTFIGSNLFVANTPGQLRFEYNATEKVGTLYGNVDMNTTADFSIEFANLTVLNATGLLL